MSIGRISGIMDLFLSRLGAEMQITVTFRIRFTSFVKGGLDGNKFKANLKVP